MILSRIGRVALPFPLALVLSTSVLLAACGGEPPPAPVAPAPPPPPDPVAPPPATTPAPIATTPPAKPEVPWKTIVEFVSPPTRAAKPEDKKLFALLPDIKKTHKECTAAAPFVTSQSATQGAFTAKGLKENAYVVEWDCNPKGTKAPAPALVFHHLVIVGGDKGDKISREVEIPERLILAMTDIDTDGDNELVLGNAPGVLSARLVELGDAPAGAVAPIFTWTSLGTTECKPGAEQDAPRLLYRMTDAQEFEAERTKRPCPAAPAAPKK
jgi:hypothetical protein